MTADTAPLESTRPDRSALDFDSSPLLVFYEVTQACDLVCEHCRACAQSKPHDEELKTAESMRLLDQLMEFPQPPMLVLTGGDPFKRPDIFELVEHGVQRGLHVSITPSATALVTRSAIDRLRDAGISRIAISIDGADAATHDGTRGVKGSFDRSLEILADIHQAGIPAQVNTTLTPRNLPQIDLMATMFARQKIAMWSVFFLVPVGRASHMDRLSADAYEKAFASLWQHAQEQPLLVKTTEAPHYRRFLIQHQIRKSQQAAGGQNPHFMSAGVNDGKGIMFVSHTGTVHPSGFLPMVCGVYPLQSVVQIYQKSPIFKSLRDANHLEGKCRACEFRHVCGGSRARAWATTGNLFAEEPDCAYLPPAFVRAT